MKAFLASFVFLVLVVLIICLDHLLDGILGRAYKNIILYGILSVVLFLALVLALIGA
jgi:hypothetical protein